MSIELKWISKDSIVAYLWVKQGSKEVRTFFSSKNKIVEAPFHEYDFFSSLPKSFGLVKKLLLRF